ncbi:MATE family efflux transporter [Microbacterium gorillae]|uniref:MATE family efflux transporter n=1 Tax=Microbacterium gorillae TaxID=1231063 RepID=UPI0006949FB8|nr:MATE family efflux transporter [Microbacterium gorillae]
MSSNNRTVLASAPIWRALIHLCIPMIAGMSVGVIYNIINAGFIGALHSTPLLAALTFSLPVFGLIMAVGGVFGVGGGTYISRLLGSEEVAADPTATAGRARQVSSFTFWGSLFTGVIVGILGLVFATPIAGLLGAAGPSLAPTALYVGAMFAFTPILVLAFALEQLVRAEGAAVASMTGLIASTIANLLLDVLFILVLGWGVLGAGLALGLSNLVMVGYYVWWLMRRSEVVSLSLRDLRVDGDILRTVFGVGASELLMSGFLIVTSLVMNWIAASYSDALLASMGVALRVAQLPEMICMGIYIGAIPLFAYAFGSGNTARLRRAISSSAIAILAVTVVFSTLVFVFREPMLALFSADPAVLADGGLVLTAMLVSTIFNGIAGLLIAVFQATGRAPQAMIMSVAQGVVFIPVVLAANLWLGMEGVIWSMTIAEAATFLLGLILFRTSRRTILAQRPDASEPVVEPAV